MRGTQTDLASPSPRSASGRSSAPAECDGTQDFSAIELRARDDFQLVFTRDQDQDGLLEREEIYYGSKDTRRTRMAMVWAIMKKCMTVGA